MVFLSILTNVKLLCEKNGKTFANKSPVWTHVSTPHSCQI